MPRTRSILPLALLLVTLPGCLYANFKFPLDEDLQETELGDKVGTSRLQAFLWLVMVGDAGTQAAAENGGIRVMTHADRAILSVLFGLYFRETTIVYGR